MDNVLIYGVTRNNYKRVLKVLEEQGVKWRSGHKPTEHQVFNEIYIVGRLRENELSYGVVPFKPRMSAEEFLKKYGADKIVITRKGRKVTATDQNGNHASARCCPEDDFDFYEGAKLALERLEEKTSKIKAGDDVRIISTGPAFTTLSAAYFTTDDELRRYVYGNSPSLGLIYRVKRVGHDGKLYIDRGLDYSGLYVIGCEGVERVKRG